MNTEQNYITESLTTAYHKTLVEAVLMAEKRTIGVQMKARHKITKKSKTSDISVNENVG